MKRISQIAPLNSQAMREAQEIQSTLVKPAGSLGELERLTVQLAGITGNPRNTVPRKVICLFGSDHGIYDEGVCSSPQDFTRKLMEVYASSQNGGINVLARQAGAELRVYDLGVKGLGEHENIITRKFLPNGTADFLHARAMSPETVRAVISFGIDLVRDMKAEGVGLIGTGEVGMGNTSPACACIMAGLKSRDDSLVGRGAGLSDEAFLRKKNVILSALEFHSPNLTDSVNILSCVGGLDIAAMTGVFLGGAIYRIPVLVDGVISVAGALMAYMIEPLTLGYMIASHESAEPAYARAAEAMNLSAPLKLGMRLGEGTGCAIMMQIIDDALAIINTMGKFQEIL
ncbi:MAG: nicotinate-nucleotide--dimethylbenzimidazole phosphoribosyltransferase [Synergistaceae bacterium]|nr:nicotinate-nucleotide--dimethylbenzimidazole phosphoribosyltransferase [Synergistaceae bacterium]MBQ3397734.1 nicotinate-nucleotide--dimethylbenzimidazole phosphoribosyltransferase [Synergistaceae bacterium]MBQ6115090.1 nicotinate-nucleotide--dimethylbenzimidazole phosphoribosyltransferase [Synergistaceae bacterium]MBR0247505.1 nicotinate-nucleotide--dimethylbenzimidazole phosphoribosyltransferase [Synergistaceae bacterium]